MQEKVKKKYLCQGENVMTKTDNSPNEIKEGCKEFSLSWTLENIHLTKEMPDLKTVAVFIGVDQFIHTVGTVMIKRKKLKSEHFLIRAK